MTPPLRVRGVRAVVLDIEGTTTPIAFVHDILFPYARAHLRAALHDASPLPDLPEAIRALTIEHARDLANGTHPPPWPDTHAEPVNLDAAEAYAAWLMDRDRKSPGLKLLQGRIWERGYRHGELKGEVFPDTAPAIRRWRAADVDVAIYSSGSVLAQRLLFESTGDGDLTPFFRGFFDTAIGPKMSPHSYARIAGELGRAPREVLFISDVAAELAAARTAGVQVLLSIRPGNPSQPEADQFEAIRSFEEVSAL